MCNTKKIGLFSSVLEVQWTDFYLDLVVKEAREPGKGWLGTQVFTSLVDGVTGGWF